MKLTSKQPQDWKDLQNKVAEILRECGFDVEIEREIETVRGKVEIDVYAEETIKGRKYTIACECKHWKSNVPQHVIHGFRTVINDLGCNIGYIITTSDFQSGSVNSTKYTNVELLTWENFIATFFESWYESYFVPQFNSLRDRVDFELNISKLRKLKDWVERPSGPRHKYDAFREFIMSYSYIVMDKGEAEVKYERELFFPVYQFIKEDSGIPVDILKETGYKELLEKCHKFTDIAISEIDCF